MDEERYQEYVDYLMHKEYPSSTKNENKAKEKINRNNWRRKCGKKFFIKDRSLWYKHKVYKDLQVLRAAETSSIIAHIHNPKPGLCRSMNKTREIISQHYFWRGIQRDVMHYITNSCSFCCTATPAAASSAAPGTAAVSSAAPGTAAASSAAPGTAAASSAAPGTAAASSAAVAATADGCGPGVAVTPDKSGAAMVTVADVHNDDDDDDDAAAVTNTNATHVLTAIAHGNHELAAAADVKSVQQARHVPPFLQLPALEGDTNRHLTLPHQQQATTPTGCNHTNSNQQEATTPTVTNRRQPHQQEATTPTGSDKGKRSLEVELDYSCITDQNTKDTARVKQDPVHQATIRLCLNLNRNVDLNLNQNLTLSLSPDDF
ncbi:hypothetical protein FHG87_021167 [Trinorchestia longiramus]|nr:hypothetical protein FHG87_021167 [Trinorchestia longiramus]